MPVPIHVVDAFAERPFAGNPAAVCLLDAPRPDAWMQSLAAEMRHSETAFLVREGAAWRLRWMTPKVEVDLCGHGTLAAAHVLLAEALAPHDAPIHFVTRSGALSARAVGNEPGVVEMDFPCTPPGVTPEDEAILHALHVRCLAFAQRLGLALVEVDSEAEVRECAPDFKALAAAFPGLVVVTGPSEDPAYHFVSRCFAPGKGIDEDPVTGSAHCALAPWWGTRLGRSDLVGYQASQRGGVVRVRVDGPRVHLSGRAVTVLRGSVPDGV